MCATTSLHRSQLQTLCSMVEEKATSRYQDCSHARAVANLCTSDTDVSSAIRQTRGEPAQRMGLAVARAATSTSRQKSHQVAPRPDRLCPGYADSAAPGSNSFTPQLSCPSQYIARGQPVLRSALILRPPHHSSPYYGTCQSMCAERKSIRPTVPKQCWIAAA